MKKTFKCFLVMLTLIIIAFNFSTITKAQSTEQDGLQVELTTDKQNYALNEDIKITVSVTNANDFTVKNVSIEALLPDNFELKNNNQTTSTNAIDIPAGDNITLQVIAIVRGETQGTTETTAKETEQITSSDITTVTPTTTFNSVETTTNSTITTQTDTTTNITDITVNNEITQKNNANNAITNSKETTSKNSKIEKSETNNIINNKSKISPLTGDNYKYNYKKLIPLFALLFFSLLILIYCVLKHIKIGKKIISILLCIIIIVTSVVGFKTYKAFAENKVDNISTINIKEKVNVDNQEYTITTNIRYVSNKINLTIDNNENKVTDFNQTLTGTFSSSVNVVSVTYKIETEIDNYEVTSSGNAIINNNTYSANIQLKPEINRITVTATTESGKTESKTLNITYDSGETYKLNKNHIAYDNKTNTKYVDNIILIIFEEGVSDTKRQEIVSSINGKVVGCINGIDQWQVEISPRNLEDLENLCTDLEKIDEVYGAFVDEIVKLSPDIVSVNDPWENAQGGNWYLDAIEAWSAWDYNERFNEINIGIVDNGFDTKHEDLSGKIYFPNKRCEINNSLEEHGTHVSGIIGAKANNNKGTTGLLWKSKLYCVDWSPSKNQEWDTISEALSGLIYTVESGVKIVNYSLGMTSSYTYNECIKNAFDTKSICASEVMVKLLNKNKDFLIVQSAGNGTSDGYAVDAKYNGLFCSITSDDITIPQNSKISKQDVLDRIIIVGNAQKNDNGTYQQYISSNGGERVDICAPGTDIFSTIPGGDFGSYGCSTGTSMSAPIVTAVCGMVWSLNNNFTGAEVKEIVCNSYDKNIWVWDNPSEKHTTQNNYRMVNAKLAVEQSFKGSVSGCVKEESDKSTPVRNIEVQAVNSKDTVVDRVQTDENGNFTLSLPEGKYKLNIGGEANNYLYENYATDITIESGVWTVLKDDILLKRINFGITGNVFDSETKTPLSDVEVKAYKDNNGTKKYITSTTTDNNGKYTLDVENSGIYSLEFNKTGYITSTQDNILTSGKLTYAENQYLENNGTGGNATFAGGNGTEQNPYKVSTPEQLNAVRNDLTAHYVQINDIDMSNWGNWEPIGDSNLSFNGTYNGNRYSISNLTININVGSDCDTGLFGHAQNSTIENIQIKNSKYNIYGKNLEATTFINAGGIVGIMENGIIQNCCFEGSIESTVGNYIYSRVSGIAAVAINSSIINCYTNSNISAKGSNMNTMVSGIASWLDGANIDKCYVAGSIMGENLNGPCYVGGINASANSTSMWGIIISYGGYVKNSAVLLTDMTANGATNYTDNIGNFSSHSNNIVLKPNSNEAMQQSTYELLNWDFRNIWNINKDKNNGLPYLIGTK